MLPLSRNETHDTSTALKPSTVDDIQDCIIGGRHGLRPLVLPAASFQKQASASQWSNGYLPHLQDAWRWYFDALSGPGQTRIVCPVILPVGATITKLRAWANKAGQSAVFSTVLQYIAPNTSNNIVVGVYDGSSGSVDASAEADCDHQIGTDRQYFITASCGHTAQTFLFAQVWYWL